MSVQFKSFKNSANFKQLFTLALAAITFLSSTGTSASAGENSCDPNQSAILVECDFSGADLSGRSFVGYVIANSKFNGATITNSDFTGVNLSGNDFSSLVSDNGTSNTNLSGSNFTNSNLGGANFTNAVMNNINISGADLTGAILDGVASNSLPEKWLLIRGYLVGPKADLRGAQLADVNFNGRDLSGVDLSNAVLARSQFDSVQFVGAKLVNANLDSANVNSASFASANLSGANLSNASLINTSFVAADLTNVNLTRAYILNTDFSKAKLIYVLRDNPFEYCYHWYYGWGYYCRDTNQSNPRVGLNNVNLSESRVTGFNSWTGSAGLVLPEGWTHRHSIFFGPSADLSGVILRQLDLTNLNLSNANLTGVD
ncbi:MAG: hypothetical protein EBT82_04405, partial [Micrococcales bacterium]|nr:hypothetical protein [Micrococcales bacterium]